MKAQFIGSLLTLAAAFNAGAVDVHLQNDSTQKPLAELRYYSMQLGFGLGEKGLAYNLGVESQIAKQYGVSFNFFSVKRGNVFSGHTDYHNSYAIKLSFDYNIRVAEWSKLSLGAGPALLTKQEHYYTRIPPPEDVDFFTALLWATWPSYDEHERKSKTIGLAIDVKWLFYSEYSGVSLHPFAVIGGKHNFVGMTLDLVIGKF